jgi:hypothetical protein
MMEEAIVHGMTHERSSETSTERWVIDIRTCGARIAAVRGYNRVTGGMPPNGPDVDVLARSRAGMTPNSWLRRPVVHGRVALVGRCRTQVGGQVTTGCRPVGKGWRLRS